MAYNFSVTASKEELPAWLTKVICGKGWSIPDDPREGHLFLAENYQWLFEARIEEFLACLFSFLKDMAENEDSIWRKFDPDFADNMVFMIGDIFSDFDGEATTEVSELLVSMIESEAWIDYGKESGVDIHGRLLQALMTLGVSMSYAFWEQQVAYNPERYLGVGLSGAQINSDGRNPLGLLIKYATDQTTKRMQDEIDECLEVMIIEEGYQWFGPRATEVEDDVPDWCRDILTEFYRDYLRSILKQIRDSVIADKVIHLHELEGGSESPV